MADGDNVCTSATTGVIPAGAVLHLRIDITGTPGITSAMFGWECVPVP